MIGFVRHKLEDLRWCETCHCGKWKGEPCKNCTGFVRIPYEPHKPIVYKCRPEPFFTFMVKCGVCGERVLRKNNTKKARCPDCGRRRHHEIYKKNMQSESFRIKIHEYNKKYREKKKLEREGMVR